MRHADNLHGAYGSIRSIVPKVSLEPYLLYRTAASFLGPDSASGRYNSWTYGFRAASAGLEHWNYEAELTGQRGDIGVKPLAAGGFTAIGGRTWNSVVWKPSAVAEYSFASGDRHPGDGLVNTLDQIYPVSNSPGTTTSGYRLATCSWRLRAHVFTRIGPDFLYGLFGYADLTERRNAGLEPHDVVRAQRGPDDVQI